MVVYSPYLLELKELVKKVEKILPETARIEDVSINEHDDLELTIRLCDCLIIIPIVRYYISPPESRKAVIIVGDCKASIAEAKVDAIINYINSRGLNAKVLVKPNIVSASFKVKNEKEMLDIAREIINAVYYLYLI